MHAIHVKALTRHGIGTARRNACRVSIGTCAPTTANRLDNPLRNMCTNLLISAMPATSVGEFAENRLRGQFEEIATAGPRRPRDA